MNLAKQRGQAVAATTGKRTGQRGRSIDEMVSYAIGHGTRVAILITLNEGVYSPGEIADIIGEPLNKVSNHIHELAEGGSIEVASTKQRRNTTQYFYRATETPEFSKEEVEAMTPYQVHVTAGLALQSLLAEIVASFSGGKMDDDPGMCLVYDRLNLDTQGRREVAQEQEESWHRIAAIEEASLNRVATSGEETVSYIASVLGFERARKAPKPSRSEIDD